ncbi:hypothetical protein G4B88_013125 [Cannabis sativa]|uniref:RNase H type-1 domain-containing protein n=1 Tax=Cannabis sativa TaxID=3483 RepID=A0A7J6I4A1_CANSA|nr:hypothetical protein G4B88_013125 [Cannabis sativa]
MFAQTLPLLYFFLKSHKSTQTIFSIASNIYSWVIIPPLPLQIAVPGIEAMIQNFPHPLTRPSLSRYFLHPSFLPSVYLIFVCLARLTSSPPLPIIFALTFTAPSMASSSTNPNILTALSEEEKYRDTLRASAQSHFKKNPFEISNATPFEELFPRSSSPDHSLQHAVNQFLRVHSPPRTTTITTSNTAIPTSPPSQTLPSTIPPPIMTTSTITHIAKGKGIALRISSPPRTRPIGLVINEPSTQSSPTSSVGTRKHFTRQSTQLLANLSIGTNLPSSSHQILPLIPNPDSDPPCSSMAKDYQDAQIHSSVSSMTNNHSPAVQDHILLPSTTALFVDATLSTNAPATGIGMVFMQGLSHIQQSARIFKPGASSPIFAEAQALCEGLQWCLSSNLTPRFIFSDCINLVSKVNGNWHDYSPLSTLVHQIRTFLSSFPEATLLHVSRQHNGKAHSLAKLALRLRDED